MSSWHKGLNPEQITAVEHDRGPLLILAGAGSGKTTVLVARAGRLIQEQIVAAKKLCVLTFTNKAARELKHRVEQKLGGTAKGIWAGTFHSFGLSLLRRFHHEAHLPREFGILDAGDAGGIVKELLKDFNYCGKTAYDEDKLLSILSHWRESGRTEARKDEEYEIATEWLLPRYLKRLEHLGMVDFDGLILKPVELMKSDERIRESVQKLYDQVMVDEFQDTNQMQMRLIQRLVETHKNVAVVGDDDQSIYGWRGACVSNILNFPKLYDGCKVVRLERNYRSTPVILRLANAVIAKNTQRHAKVLRSDRTEDGDAPELFVYENENEEAENVANEIQSLVAGGSPRKSIAVLYRSNSQGAMIEAELRRLGIAYAMSGGTAFFDRKEIRDVLAYLRSAIKPNEVSFRRILNTPSRGIGDKTIEHLTQYSRDNQRNFVEASRRWREVGIDEKIGAALEELWHELGTLVATILSAAGMTPGERLMRWLEEVGYKRHLAKHAPDHMVAAKRWRFLELFARLLDRFLEVGGRSAETVKEFIDAMELRDTRDDDEKNADKVQLLTLHACKGLEFPTVFLLGVEEDIIPHKTLGTDIAEERRLFYVGVTRAEKRLILTRAKRRKRHGRWIDSPPSRFLLEIPKGLLKEFESSRPVCEEKRKSMLGDFWKKMESLDGKI